MTYATTGLIQSYADLQAAISDFLNRPDLTAQPATWIQLAEATLNKHLRAPYMVAHANVAVSSRNAALPADFLEPVYVQVLGTDTAPLEQVSPQQLVQLRRRFTSTGAPLFFAVVGGNVEVSPSPSLAAPTTLDVAYYQQIPALSATNPSNTTLQLHPDLYLYTALLHASPYLSDDDRVALFTNILVQEISATIKANSTSSFADIKSPGPSLGDIKP